MSSKCSLVPPLASNPTAARMRNDTQAPESHKKKKKKAFRKHKRRSHFLFVLHRAGGPPWLRVRPTYSTHAWYVTLLQKKKKKKERPSSLSASYRVNWVTWLPSFNHMLEACRAGAVKPHWSCTLLLPEENREGSDFLSWFFWLSTAAFRCYTKRRKCHYYTHYTIQLYS